ncbi:MAG: hypothetical protein ABIR46_01355 [Candidatus Saccharimonadales bacterium]
MAQHKGAPRRTGLHDTDGSFRFRPIVVIMALLALIASFLFALTTTAIAADDTTTTTGDQVCQGLDSGKIDTTGDPESVTVTAPEGKLIDGYCVKAGSVNNDNGPVYVTVDPPAKTVTITYPGGKDISHYSVSYVDAPPPPPDACPDMPGTQTPGTTCTTPPPPDACPEMPGIQPPGTVCTTPPPTDACPDMPGTQTPGTVCTTPPPPVTDACPNMPGNQPTGTVCVTPTPTPVPVPTTTPTPTPTPEPVKDNPSAMVNASCVTEHFGEGVARLNNKKSGVKNTFRIVKSGPDKVVTLKASKKRSVMLTGLKVGSLVKVMSGGKLLAKTKVPGGCEPTPSPDTGFRMATSAT